MFKRICLITLVALSFSTNASAEMLLSLGGDYNQTNLEGANQNSKYRGNGYWGELEYLIAFNKDNALSPFIRVHRSHQKDGSNKINQAFSGGGLKYWRKSNFLSLGYGKISYQEDNLDEATIITDDKASSFYLSAGRRIRLSKSVGLVLAVGAYQARPEFTDTTGTNHSHKQISYQASLGLSFALSQAFWDTLNYFFSN